MMHGTNDKVIQLKYGIESKEHLESLGYSVNWCTYNMGHSISPWQIYEISNWLKARFLA